MEVVPVNQRHLYRHPGQGLRRGQAPETGTDYDHSGLHRSEVTVPGPGAQGAKSRPLDDPGFLLRLGWAGQPY
jgi:hypothetical protein